MTQQPIKSNPKDEINPWPLVLYAPGNYKNTCASCEKQMKGVDKLCFMCLECAVIASHKYRDQLREESRRLREALEKSVEVIRYWHNVGGLFAHLNNDEITETWKIYYDQSDEMKPIREALASVSDAGNKEETKK